MIVPSELPDIGSTAQRLRVNPRFDPVVAGIGPEDYFVWTRFDGATSLRELILMTGLGTARAIEIVTRLRALGAVLLPGESPEAVSARLRSGASPASPVLPAASRPTPAGGVRARPDSDAAPTIERPPTGPITVPSGPDDEDDRRPTARVQASAVRSGSPAVPPTSGIRIGAGSAGPPSPGPKVTPTTPGIRNAADDARETTRVRASEMRGAAVPPTSWIAGEGASAALRADEQAALEEPCALPPDERRRILLMHRRVASNDPHLVLGVPATADRRELKRAYFALSKEYHPDRFYGRPLGTFGPRLTAIFEAVARAYAELTGTPRGGRNAAGPSTQSPGEHAADLFERACQAEIAGQLPTALRLFAAALRLEPTARHLRRAARCAIAAGEKALAVEYAKKAASLEPNDASTARVLAAAFRTAARYDDAEEVLVLALMIKTESDQLAHELRADLAEVRRLAGRR